MKSTHKVEVVRVRREPHPNADSLSIVRVFDGYTVCVKTADWAGRPLGAYIPPDSVVDSSRPEFAFLAGHNRIKVKRLRGVVSMGLLIPAPEGAELGDDVAEQLGVTHYEPPTPTTAGGECEPAPPGYHPEYDVDTLRRYAHVFTPGEPVFVTEKIHGGNVRYCWSEGRMRAGSRTTWKKYDPANVFWLALSRHPEIVAFCEKHPEITVYGEVYGWMQDLRYGARKGGDVWIAVFDLLAPSGWIPPREARAMAPDLPWVPTFSEDMPFDLRLILSLAEGQSLIPGADHIREGVVVKPLLERTHPEIGRVCLKVVGNGYLER